MGRKAKLKRGLKNIEIAGGWHKFTVPTTVGIEVVSSACMTFINAISDIDLSRSEATRISNHWNSIFRKEAMNRGKIASGKFYRTTKSVSRVKESNQDKEVIDIARLTTDYGDDVEHGVRDATNTTIYNNFTDFHKWVKKKKSFMQSKGSWDRSSDGGLNLSDVRDVKQFWESWKTKVEDQSQLKSSRYVYEGVNISNVAGRTEVSTEWSDRNLSLLFMVDMQTEIFIRKIIQLTPKRRKEIADKIRRDISLAATPYDYVQIVNKHLEKIDRTALHKDSIMYLRMVRILDKAINEFKFYVNEVTGTTVNNFEKAYADTLNDADRKFNNIKKQMQREVSKKGLVLGQKKTHRLRKNIQEKLIHKNLRNIEGITKDTPKSTINDISVEIKKLTYRFAEDLIKKRKW